jgi:hypothetical protein
MQLDCVGDVFVAKGFRASRRGEILAPLYYQHAKLAKFAVVKYL